MSQTNWFLCTIQTPKMYLGLVQSDFPTSLGLLTLTPFIYFLLIYIYIYLVFFLLNFYQLYFGHFSNLKYLFLSKYDFICDIKIFGFASLFKT